MIGPDRRNLSWPTGVASPSATHWCPTICASRSSERTHRRSTLRGDMASPRLATTIMATLLATGGGATQEPDTFRIAGVPLSVQPIAPGTVVLRLGRHVVLIDPARFLPGHPEPPRQDLQEMAKAHIARFGAPPKPPASSDDEPNPDLLVSALPIRADQISRSWQWVHRQPGRHARVRRRRHRLHARDAGRGRRRRRVRADELAVHHPYHYFGSDPKVFAAALESTGIEVRLRDWYAAGR